MPSRHAMASSQADANTMDNSMKDVTPAKVFAEIDHVTNDGEDLQGKVIQQVAVEPAAEPVVTITQGGGMVPNPALGAARASSVTLADVVTAQFVMKVTDDEEVLNIKKKVKGLEGVKIMA